MDYRYISDKLAEWYHHNHRNLPWRHTKNPYRIWLSEIILQQTRVKQGLPYYLKFIETFPTIHHLAKAREREVMRCWQGLGYYTRARNLHKCARLIVSEYGGTFPNNYESLKKLPGIGDYTAAAIASFCFGETIAVVDGNVYRVLSRIFGIETDITRPEGKKTFFSLANTLIGKVNPGLHNQAIMEFGALHCTPTQPGCKECIFETTCAANKHGLQQVLPVKGIIKASRRRYLYYVVFISDSGIGMKRRSEKDIWAGLYDFYLIETTRPQKVQTLFENDNHLKKVSPLEEEIVVTKTYKHILSHQTILAKFITIHKRKKSLKIPEGVKFYSKKRVDSLPKPVLVSKFLKDIKIL